MYDAASAGTVQGGGPEPLSPSVAVGLELVTEPGSALPQSGCAHKYTQIIIYILSVYISEMIFAREPHFFADVYRRCRDQRITDVVVVGVVDGVASRVAA